MSDDQFKRPPKILSNVPRMLADCPEKSRVVEQALRKIDQQMAQEEAARLGKLRAKLRQAIANR